MNSGLSKFPGADDTGNMFQFHADFQKDYLEIRDIEVCRSLNPELKDFDMWLKVSIPISLLAEIFPFFLGSNQVSVKSLGE